MPEMAPQFGRVGRNTKWVDGKEAGRERVVNGKRTRWDLSCFSEVDDSLKLSYVRKRLVCVLVCPREELKSREQHLNGLSLLNARSVLSKRNKTIN